jgi:hypothetical protein
MLAPDNEPVDIHPGHIRQKRLSSAETANAPMELLRKWTDQGKDRRQTHVPANVAEVDWRDSKFSFTTSNSDATENTAAKPPSHPSRPPLSRNSTDLVSPKTARVHSVGSHVVVGVDGSLEHCSNSTKASGADDSYEAITRAILMEHGAVAAIEDVVLCIHYGGRTKTLNHTDKPLEIVKDYEDRELDPRLLLRKRQGKPP